MAEHQGVKLKRALGGGARGPRGGVWVPESGFRVIAKGYIGEVRVQETSSAVQGREGSEENSRRNLAEMRANPTVRIDYVSTVRLVPVKSVRVLVAASHRLLARW